MTKTVRAHALVFGAFWLLLASFVAFPCLNSLSGVFLALFRRNLGHANTAPFGLGRERYIHLRLGMALWASELGSHGCAYASLLVSEFQEIMRNVASLAQQRNYMETSSVPVERFCQQKLGSRL